MLFEEALKYLREGKKIRRNCWPIECFLLLKDGYIYEEDGTHLDEMITNNIFLDDWELYKEKEEPKFKGCMLDMSIHADKDKLRELEERIILLEKK